MYSMIVQLPKHEYDFIQDSGFNPVQYLNFLAGILSPTYYADKVKFLMDLSVAVDALHPYLEPEGEVLFNQLKEAIQNYCLLQM